MFNETHHTFLPKTSEGQSCKGTETYCNHLSLMRLPVILPTASGTFLPLKFSVASSLISPHHNLKGRGSYLRGQGRRRNLRQGKEKDRETVNENQNDVLEPMKSGVTCSNGPRGVTVHFGCLLFYQISFCLYRRWLGPRLWSRKDSSVLSWTKDQNVSGVKGWTEPPQMA